MSVYSLYLLCTCSVLAVTLYLQCTCSYTVLAFIVLVVFHHKRIKPGQRNFYWLFGLVGTIFRKSPSVFECVPETSSMFLYYFLL